MGSENPERKCIRRRKAYPICAFPVQIMERNELGQMVEVIGLCKACDRSERNKAAAIKTKQRRKAYMRHLQKVNENLTMEFDAFELIWEETEIERQRMKSLMMTALAETEDARKRKEAMA